MIGFERRFEPDELSMNAELFGPLYFWNGLDLSIHMIEEAKELGPPPLQTVPAGR